MTTAYEGRSTRDSAARQLDAVAAAQHGVFSRAQALASGVSTSAVDRRLTSGAWERLYQGVYRLASAPRTWRQSLLAACLAWGVGAVISHRAAAALWAFAGFTPGRIELSVPIGRRRERAHLVHWPASLASTDTTTLYGIPVTTAMRTLIDIAGCAPADVVEEALDDALRRKLVTVARFQRRLREDGGPGRSGTALLRDLVDARAGVARGPESTLETRLLRVLRAAGLPPVVQHRVGRYRVDFAYPGARVAVEADGFRWHSTRQQWDHDRARRNALTAMGWTVIHVTWEQLHQRPDEVIDSIRETLRGRL
jgi:very-short-patch-repair endonuclease